MKFGKKKLQELKEKKISIEELNDRYFINSQYKIEVDNIRKLLNENICSFKEIIDKFKGIKDDRNHPCLYYLLYNEELFEELIQNNRLNTEDLRYLWSQVDNDTELANLSDITTLLKCIIDNNIVSFQKLIDKYKNTEDSFDGSCLRYLLRSKEIFNELALSNKLNIEDLGYLWSQVDKWDELNELRKNTSLLKYSVDKDLFKDLVDTFKSMKDSWNNLCLYRLLENKELFEELIENNKLNKEDLRYLLNRINEDYELHSLCKNTSLIKHILNEFVLNREVVDRFNTIIGNDDWLEERNIHNIFEYIEDKNKDNEEILNLNELNKYVCSFELTETQRLELAEILKNNEIAQNLLKQLVDNHLEDTYDFENLKNLLNKDSEKKKIKLNL